MRIPLPLLPALMAAVLMLPAGCASYRHVALPLGSPLIEREEQDLTLSLRFVNELELRRLFGAKTNPFLTRRWLLPYPRLLVFELAAAHRGAVRLQWSLKGCELSMGGKILLPMSPAGLGGYWESRDRNPEANRARTQILEKHMLPASAIVYPGEVLRGYLVFRAAGDPAGPVRVKIVLSMQNLQLSLIHI